jgi:hypothetical protein
MNEQATSNLVKLEHRLDEDEAYVVDRGYKRNFYIQKRSGRLNDDG